MIIHLHTTMYTYTHLSTCAPMHTYTHRAPATRLSQQRKRVSLLRLSRAARPCSADSAARRRDRLARYSPQCRPPRCRTSSRPGTRTMPRTDRLRSCSRSVSGEVRQSLCIWSIVCENCQRREHCFCHDLHVPHVYLNLPPHSYMHPTHRRHFSPFVTTPIHSMHIPSLIHALTHSLLHPFCI